MARYIFDNAVFNRREYYADEKLVAWEDRRLIDLWVRGQEKGVDVEVLVRPWGYYSVKTLLKGI